MLITKKPKGEFINNKRDYYSIWGMEFTREKNDIFEERYIVRSGKFRADEKDIKSRNGRLQKIR